MRIKNKLPKWGGALLEMYAFGSPIPVKAFVVPFLKADFVSNQFKVTSEGILYLK